MGGMMGGGGMSASSGASGTASQGDSYYGGSPVTLEGINRSNMPPWILPATVVAMAAGMVLFAKFAS